MSCNLDRPAKCRKELEVQRAQVGSVGVCNNGLRGALPRTHIESQQGVVGPWWQPVQSSQLRGEGRLVIVESHQPWHWRVNSMASQRWQGEESEVGEDEPGCLEL